MGWRNSVGGSPEGEVRFGAKVECLVPVLVICIVIYIDEKIMTTISVQRFYITRVTAHGVQRVPSTVTAIAPDPTESENDYFHSSSSSEDEIDDTSFNNNNIIYESESTFTEGSSNDEGNPEPTSNYMRKTYNMRGRSAPLTQTHDKESDESSEVSNNESSHAQQPSSSNARHPCKSVYRMRIRLQGQPMNNGDSENESSDDDQTLSNVHVTSANYRWRKRNPEGSSNDEGNPEPTSNYMRKTYNMRGRSAPLTQTHDKESDESSEVSNNESSHAQQPSSSNARPPCKSVYRMRIRLQGQPMNNGDSENESSDDDQTLSNVHVTSANYRWRKRNPVPVNSSYIGMIYPILLRWYNL